MNAQDREHISEIKSSVRSLGEQIRTDIRDIWKAREADKLAATADNERRHQELREDFARVIDRLDQLNGRARSNTERIAIIEGERTATAKRAGVSGAVGAGGAVGVIWAIVELIKVLQ